MSSIHSILNRLSHSSDYTILPSQSPSQISEYSRWTHVNVPKRYTRFFIAILLALTIYTFSLRHITHDWREFPPEALPSPDGSPPLYLQYREYERHLPAHNPALPYPDGEHAKFIYFGNHQNAVGWGNVLQEMIFNAYFAYHVKRSFVFYNYSWNMDGPEFSDFNGHTIPSRIPLSAIITGPMVGGPMDPEDVDVPRAVSRDYFNQVCPESERYMIRGDDVKEGHWDLPAHKLINALKSKVLATDARCIELPRWSSQIFDVILFGSTGVLELWPELSKSPIFTKFGWSPLVHAAFNANRRYFEISPRPLPPFYGSLPGYFSKTSSPMNPPASPYPPLDGLLVIHVRQGDFDKHCRHFVTHSSEYNGFNAFPELPDRFDPPQGEDTPEKVETYLRHCFPNISQIVERVVDVREKSEGLKKMYIMTNAKRQWLDELKEALREKSEWEEITTSRDLWLSWEQKPVAQALDMYVAQRAQAFVGNGFSSLTSNVVMFRMGSESLDPNNTFFW
ncbi:hypothetical protein AX17_006837 [Amanita inopinata Kibby_2008]|nr:hypothetical protein AX17_006837 [Amanita inopinata Kibby_2008]